MKLDILKFIKEDMKEIRRCRQDVQKEINERLAELAIERKEALAEYVNLPEDDWYRSYIYRTTNEAYNRQCQKAINGVYNMWHNDQMYHLIYKDGSEVVISAEEILGGVKFPKISDIVYAEMSSADDHMDTEVGDIHWYSDERMEACDWDYTVEDEHRWQYETAIQYKYNTEWAKQWSRKHPEFVPIIV